jgi:hypothetical protein
MMLKRSTARRSRSLQLNQSARGRRTGKWGPLKDCAGQAHHDLGKPAQRAPRSIHASLPPLGLFDYRRIASVKRQF